MEVFAKYFTRLVASNAGQIFPIHSRATSAAPNYQLLVKDMHVISQDLDMAPKIAYAIATGSEDIFRDFDLATFMDHFKLTPLGKTVLALAVKQEKTRPDLQNKGWHPVLRR